MHSLLDSLKNIAQSKFSPPRIDHERLLHRPIHFEKLCQRKLIHKKALLLEAQAGQGKSTFAAQLLAHLKTDFSWYQVGPEDEDPVFLLIAIALSLRQKLPKLRSRMLDNLLTTGIATPREVTSCAERLIKELNKNLKTDFFLVLDDVYLLQQSPLSLTLLSQFLTTVDNKFHLILLSRTSILPVLQINLPAELIDRLGNEDLALCHKEVAELFSDVFHLPVTVETVQALHNTTEGWITGLMLLANTSLAENISTRVVQPEFYQSDDKASVLDYFMAEIISQVSPAMQQTLVKLALLPQISIPLAKHLDESGSIQSMLIELEQRNFFIRCIDPDKSTFVFHHLFQESLQRHLHKVYQPFQIKDIANQIALWYQVNDQPEAALDFFLRAQNFDAAQQVLRQVGMTLHAEGRVLTLQAALEKVPEEIIGTHPWMAYYRAITLISGDPPATLTWLKRARAGFERSTDELGELLVLILTIYFHAAVDFNFRQGLLILNRAEVLYMKLPEQLALPQRIHAANLLMIGHTIFNADFERATRFLHLGVEQASTKSLDNLMAEAYMARCYRHLFAADLRACRLDVERCWHLLHSSHVNTINKGALQIAFLNLLTYESDEHIYQQQKSWLKALLGEERVERGTWGAILRILDIDWDLSQGRMAEARDATEQALDSDYNEAGPHLRSQFLQYHSLLLAYAGKRDSALQAAQESMVLRNEIGGRFFEAINAAIVGGAFVHVNCPEMAQSILSQGLSKSQEMGEYYIRAALLAQRATLYLKQGDEQKADDDIALMLQIMQQKHYVRFWGGTPGLLETLLGRAVRSGTRVDFVRRLAATRLESAVLDDGSVIPLLKIHTLGRLEIQFKNQIILRAEDFTDSQRRLLAMLVVAPGSQMHQEEIQSILWPEASPSRSRSCFDNLVSRLRKLMEQALKGAPVKNYLKLQKGILRLDHCWVDFKAFEEKAKAAGAHVRKNELWEADNTFVGAFHLWQGNFMSGVPLSDTAELKRHDLSLLYQESALIWCRILAQKEQLSEAVSIADRALQQNPTHEALVRSLYDLHARSGDCVQARKTLNRYVEALKRDGFSPKECERLLDAFWSHPL